MTSRIHSNKQKWILVVFSSHKLFSKNQLTRSTTKQFPVDHSIQNSTCDTLTQVWKGRWGLLKWNERFSGRTHLMFSCFNATLTNKMNQPPQLRGKKPTFGMKWHLAEVGFLINVLKRLQWHSYLHELKSSHLTQSWQWDFYWFHLEVPQSKLLQWRCYLALKSYL